MPRLFVAIRLPPLVCDALVDAMDVAVEGARWQDDEQLHLTLRFVGEVEDRIVDDINDTLAGIDAAAMDIRLSQPGVFDRRGRVDSLWIGAQPREPLAALHRKVDRALVGLGLPPERRAYLPHVTLARFGRRGGDCGEWIANHARLSPPSFLATAFELVESDVNGDGARYGTVARFALRPPSS